MKNVMENKNLIIAVVVVIVVLIVALSLGIKSSNTLKCSIDKEIIKGFNNNESLVFKFGKKKLKSIKLDRTISLSEYYAERGTYTETLEMSLNNAYKYLGDSYKINKADDKVTVNIDTTDKGIVLDNLIIKYNSEDDDTTLRFDVETDLDSEKAFKIGDEYKKADVKKTLTDMGYTCK